jgi:hypothetical protein
VAGRSLHGEPIGPGEPRPGVQVVGEGEGEPLLIKIASRSDLFFSVSRVIRGKGRSLHGERI